MPDRDAVMPTETPVVLVREVARTGLLHRGRGHEAQWHRRCFEERGTRRIAPGNVGITTNSWTSGR